MGAGNAEGSSCTGESCSEAAYEPCVQQRYSEFSVQCYGLSVTVSVLLSRSQTAFSGDSLHVFSYKPWAEPVGSTAGTSKQQSSSACGHSVSKPDQVFLVRL